ncbi:MAG: hypothetical protein TEF_14380 [Rhizobiales bacterium NRL2]|jgi:hypothetical protein|nr:MAG: hypothetical protein TEF_14380 [Rhizobiales bacterium NRL2]
MEMTSRRAVPNVLAPIFGGILLSQAATLSAESDELAPSPFEGHAHAFAIHSETGELLLRARPICCIRDGGESWHL